MKMAAKLLEQLGVAFAGADSVRLVCAALFGFLVSLLVGRRMIALFNRRGVIEDVSQPDSETLDRLRASKKGTPTMGGLMIIAGVLASVILFAGMSVGVALAIGIMLIFGGLGAVDDYIKLRFGSKEVGRKITRKKKLLIALAAGAASGWVIMIYAPSGEAGILSIPFVSGSIYVGWGYLAIAAIIVAGAANGVNLADGLDGLAGGTSMFAALALAAIGIIGGASGSVETAVVCLGLAGALAGFLVYNRHPARIFMGDTGSLAIGGLIGVATLSLGQEILFLLLGSVFVLEALSVAMQVGWYKLTRKRIFKCAPYHHHLEFLGWNERRVTRHFWLVSALAGCLSVLLVAGG